MAIERVEKPKTVGVLRSTPAQNTSQNANPQQGPVREQHRILLEVESEDDRPLPDRHNVTLFVENTTKGRCAANQKHDVIVNQLSREFSAEKGEALKTYVIPSTQDAVLEDLRSNSNVQQSESEGLISALAETGQEVEANGTILHHFTYKVPGKTTFKMMRIKQTPHTTISELTVEHDPSKKWYVLEAGGPDSKVSGKGRIEKGTYQLTPYSSSNYPSEFQLKQVPGRTNIIMYEYDTSTKLTTGLALAKSYDFSDDTKQYYKVDGSADAKKEIYGMIGDGEAEIVIGSGLDEKPLKHSLWHAIDNIQSKVYLNLREMEIKRCNETIRKVQEALSLMNIETVADGIYGGGTEYSLKVFQKNYLPDREDEEGVSLDGDLLLRIDEALQQSWVYKARELNELEILVCTIYGEASYSSEEAWLAIYSSIVNRVENREWKRYQSVLDVIKHTGYDAYSHRNEPYRLADEYYGSGVARERVVKSVVDRIQSVIAPYYNRNIPKYEGIVLYYSPQAQESLHKAKPNLYTSTVPSWNFEKLDEVVVKGAESDDFKFFKYK